MICKFCDSSVPGGAIFCPSCGKRLDGKTPCPKCGAMNDESAIYCTACGTRLDGKAVCRNCGTAFEGNFCPQCGTASVEQQKTPREKRAFDWRKLLIIIGGACSMAAVFFSLLFTFFIGFEVTGAQASSGNQNAFDVWYFFSDAYKEVDTILQAAIASNEEVSMFAKSSLYMEAAIGTVVSVATIVTVVVFSAIAIARYVRYMLHKSDKGAGLFACLAVFFFIAGTLTLRALYDRQVSAAVNITMQTVRVDTTLGANAATAAGITLSAIFLGIWFGCLIATRGKELIGKNGLRSLIPAVVGMVLLTVILAVAGYGAVGFSGSEQLHATGAGNDSMKVTLGFPIILEVLAEQFITLPYDGAADAAAAYTYIAAIFTIAVIVLACLNFARLASSAEKRVSALPMAIVLFACCIFYTTFSILSINTTANVILNELGTADAVIDTKFATAIVVCVFAALNLAAAIVQKALARKN